MQEYKSSVVAILTRELVSIDNKFVVQGLYAHFSDLDLIRLKKKGEQKLYSYNRSNNETLLNCIDTV